MKRLAAAAVAVGAFLLVGCSSSGPSQVGGSTPGSASSGAPSTAAPSTAASPTAASSATTSLTAASSAAASSAPATATLDSGTATTASTSSPISAGSTTRSDSAGSVSSRTSSGSSTPKTTLGGTVDSDTTVWFSTLCSTLAPIKDLGAGASGAGTDPRAAQALFVKQYNSIGDAFIGAAQQLRTLPPPTFAGGPKFAAQAVAALGQAGPALKATAASVAAAKPTSTQALYAAVEAAGQKVQDALGGLNAMDNYEFDAATNAEIAKIPSCKAAGFFT